MLRVTISPADDIWDEREQKFLSFKGADLELEHSLVAISKWEQKYHKAFTEDAPKSYEETCYYVKCMTLNEVDDAVYSNIPQDVILKVNEYIADPATAMTFTPEAEKLLNKGRSRSLRHSVLRSEEIYALMVDLNIPVEFENWHLNRLLTLIKVITLNHEESNPDNKMSRNDILARNAKLNAARRKAMKTKG